MGRECRRKGYEHGPYYEIKTVADIIKSKEARGADASFERGLLSSWSHYDGYEGAKEALAGCGKPVFQE